VKSLGVPVARYGIRRHALVAAIGSQRLPRPVRGTRAHTVGALSVKATPSRLAALLGPLGVVFGQAVLGDAVGLLSGLGDMTAGVRSETGETTLSSRLVPDPG
jgi:hypothetical protein